MKPVVTTMSDFSRERHAFCVLDNFIMSMTPVYDFPTWKESLKMNIWKKGDSLMKTKKKLGLTTMIFIALILGALTGIIINYVIPSNKVIDDFIVGRGFLCHWTRLYTFNAYACCTTSFLFHCLWKYGVGDTKKLGAVGLKTMLFYLCTTAFSCCGSFMCRKFD